MNEIIRLWWNRLTDEEQENYMKFLYDNPLDIDFYGDVFKNEGYIPIDEEGNPIKVCPVCKKEIGNNYECIHCGSKGTN